MNCNRGKDWRAAYRGKQVAFNLHPLEQEPPRQFELAANEKFIQRTFDESGYEFFLLFNTERNYFFWVLNEEGPVPDTFVPDPGIPELLIGNRSGFAFWVDAEHGDRKVMLAIRRLNSSRNDYYDGPFDQLADNYADETEVAKYMQLAAPGLRGRIDKYGYYTDTERPSRPSVGSWSATSGIDRPCRNCSARAVSGRCSKGDRANRCSATWR